MGWMIVGIVFIVLIIFVAVLLLRAAMFTPKPQPAPSQERVTLDEERIVADMQQLIRCKLQYYNSIVGGAIDARFMPAILKGIMEKMDEGPLTGSYARDIRVTIYYGKMHPVDSNELSFKLAGRNAFKEAFRNAGPKIMEPIYNVEVLTPSEYMGAVMSDLQNRRAMIMGMESDKGFDRLNARVPLAELYRYSTSLSSLTSGAATYTMQFASYEQVPADVQEKLLKEYTDTDEE